MKPAEWKTPPASWQADGGGKDEALANGIVPPAQKIGNPLALTVFTNDAGRMTKEYSLDAAGHLRKSTAAQLAHGSYSTVPCDDLHAFADLLSLLEPNQALGFGLADAPAGRLVTSANVQKHPGAIARTKEHFAFRPKPGIMMIDYDWDHWPGLADYAALRDLLVSACPALADAPALSAPSASSCIFNGETGEQTRGLRGQRFYIAVRDASDIPRAGKALYDRLWLAGVGQFVVSESGQLLDRNAVDASVWRGHGLDFAAGAACKAPLVRRPIPPRVWGDPSGRFDTRLILDLTPEEQAIADRHRAAARGRKGDEAAAKRETFKGQQVARYVERGLSPENARQLVSDAIDRGMLFGDFVLVAEDGRTVTVGEVLDHREKWHGQRFADPLEPTYRGDRRIAWVNLFSGGRPYLHSFAHGGQRYALLRQPARVTVAPGEYPRVTDDVLAVLREQGDLFEYGDRSIVRVTPGGDLAPLTKTTALNHIEREIVFEQFDARTGNMRRVNCPDRIGQTLLDMHGERGFSKLDTVLSVSGIRPDGSLITQPGYDPATRIFYSPDRESPLTVPEFPSMREVRAAFEELWGPFAQFPCDGDQSRGVLLAAILTACSRATISPAPGFGFDAPTAGSGKTLLARSLANLAGSHKGIDGAPRDEAEADKKIFTHLREGWRAIVWDNYEGIVDGVALNAMLTSDQFSGRVLGVSENPSFPNRALFVVTGNNLRVAGDTCRRVLVCRIDTRSETPFFRQFDFDPAERCASRRALLVRAALTLIRGALTLNAAELITGRLGGGRLASFETWDDLIRQTVLWLDSERMTFQGREVGFGDPAASIFANFEQDPKKRALSLMLAAWRHAFGDRPAGAGEFVKFRELATFESEGDSPLQSAFDALSENGRPVTAAGLGRWLERHKGQIAGGCAFESYFDANAKTHRWRVREILG